MSGPTSTFSAPGHLQGVEAELTGSLRNNSAECSVRWRLVATPAQHRPISRSPLENGAGAARLPPHDAGLLTGAVGSGAPVMAGDDEHDAEMEHMEALEQLQKRTAQGAGGSPEGRTSRARRTPRGAAKERCRGPRGGYRAD